MCLQANFIVAPFSITLLALVRLSQHSGMPCQFWSNLTNIVNFTQSDIGSMIYASTAVICASLPTYKPLFPKIAGAYRNLRSRLSHFLRSRSESSIPSIMGPSETLAVKARYAKFTDGGAEGGSLSKAEA